MSWTPWTPTWQSYIPEYPAGNVLPAKYGTPEAVWAYGAVSDLVETGQSAVIRIKAKASKGQVGFALISEDYSNLASNQVMISPEDGEHTVELKFNPEKSPARLLIRNYNDPGKTGEVEVLGIEIGL